MNAKTVLLKAATRLAAAGVESARLDAELLLMKASGKERLFFYAHPDWDVPEDILILFEEYLGRREGREPLAYITGQKEFYGRSFFVSPAVLIPRPDTEILIDEALNSLKAHPEAEVLDLCTGSGCIGITLALESKARVTLTDLSEDSLEIARKNSVSFGLSLPFYQGDLFDALPEDQAFDLIVSNPPYIKEADIPSLVPEIREYEPMLALSGGDDGYFIYRRLIRDARRCLKPGGMILLEHGDVQAENIRQLLDAEGYIHSYTKKDLSGRDRITAAFLV